VRKPRYTLGWPDGSGKDTILEDGKPVFVLWANAISEGMRREGDMDESERLLLRETVVALNAHSSRCLSKKPSRRRRQK
jgi:hypothetical protein